MNRAMSATLTVTENEDEVVFVIGGAITEAVDFAPLIEKAGKRVRIDLSLIERINSYGIRNWIHFLAALSARGGDVALDRCAVPMVRQMNMIPSALGSARVLSVQVPYYCPTCDDERVRLLELLPGQKPTPPAGSQCPTCGDNLELDERPEAYFGFWKA